MVTQTRVYTVAEAAVRVGTTPAEVARAIALRTLPAVVNDNEGYIQEPALLQWWEQRIRCLDELEQVHQHG